MLSGPAYIKARALELAVRLLHRAAAIFEMNIDGPFFLERFGTSANAFMARWERTGVLKVLDPDTGRVLAASLPGAPATLDPSFEPDLPALTFGQW